MSDGASPPDARAVAGAFGIGEPREAMNLVSGGLTNRIWRLTTTSGTYAIKQMAPVMERASLIEWTERAFRLERAAIANGVEAPAPVPTVDGGRCLAELGQAESATGGLVRVHEWVEAERVPPVVFPPDEVRRVGRILARVHALDIPAADIAREALRVEGEDFWFSLVEQVERTDLPWAWELRAYVPLLLDVEAYVGAARDDGTPLILSHRDADQKNVMRTQDDRLLLVDWDAAGPVNPRHDLANMALTWAGVHLGEPDARAVRAFLDGYRDAGGNIDRFERTDLAEMVSVQQWWLERNIRRALGGPKFDAAQVSAAREGVPQILRRDKLRRYLRHIDRWIAMLNG